MTLSLQLPRPPKGGPPRHKKSHPKSNNPIPDNPMTQPTTLETPEAEGFVPVGRLESGLYVNISEPEYHADPAPQPSLSSSLARTLLYESPAHAKLAHPRLRDTLRGERESTAAMSTGSIVHAMLAGEEAMKQSLEIGHFNDYRSNAAKEWRDEVKASGRTPLLEKDLHEASEIAAAVRLALPGLFDEGGPWKELTAVWQDIGGHYCRARIDCLQHHATGGASIWDWKTASDVSDRAIEKACTTYRYPFQLAFYLRGLGKLLPKVTAWDAKLVFVEATAPHTVRLVSFSEDYMAYAAQQVEGAIELWADCMGAEDFSDPRHGQDLTLELPDWLIEEPEIIIE